MNIIKTTAVIIAVQLAIISLQAINQNTDRANKMIRNTVERITKTYELEPAQIKPMTEIVKVRVTKVLSTVDKQDNQLMIAEIKNTSEDFRKSMDSILTADQKSKFAAKKEAVLLAIAEKNKDKKRSQTNKK